MCSPLPLTRTPSAAKEHIELLLSLGANRSEATKAVVKKVGRGLHALDTGLLVLGMLLLLVPMLTRSTRTSGSAIWGEMETRGLALARPQERVGDD